MRYKEGDLVLCTVKDVGNTVTSVVLDDGTKGTIISSEIASGRIKYMRMYVVPNKKIVCKVLLVGLDSLDLSLRRVSLKEKQEVMKEYKQKVAIDSAFEQILKEDCKEVKEKIINDFGSLLNFINQMNDELIAKYIPSECIEHIKKINEKRHNLVEIKYSVSISCLESDGVLRIKKVLENNNDKLKIIYISAGNFILKYSAIDFKQGKQEILNIIDNMKEKAKQNNCIFEFKEEKK